MGHQLVPLYMTDSHHCILLDTGSRYIRSKLETALAEHDITPIGLLCTHTHFDHFGNAKYFSEKYHCPVALPLGEAEICRTAASVKSHLFVFTAGQVASDPEMNEIPCVVDHVIRPEETDTFFRGVRFRVLHTPGHSMDHCSYITPDNVCYVGDALLCGRTLSGSKLPYAFDMRQSFRTIEQMKDISCDAMIISHEGILYEGFRELCEQNLAVMEEQFCFVRNLVDHAMSTNEICCAVCEKMGVVVDTPKKAQSLERFLRPYMECFVDDGSHRMVIKNSTLCFEPVE